MESFFRKVVDSRLATLLRKKFPFKVFFFNYFMIEVSII